MQPHKYAEILIAIADGKTIEWRCQKQHLDWSIFCGQLTPLLILFSGDDGCEFRIWKSNATE